MRTFISVNKYAKKHQKTATLILRLVKAANLGDRLPGGGIVVEDPEGRRWVEVEVEPAEKTA